VGFRVMSVGIASYYFNGALEFFYNPNKKFILHLNGKFKMSPKNFKKFPVLNYPKPLFSLNYAS